MKKILLILGILLVSLVSVNATITNIEFEKPVSGETISGDYEIKWNTDGTGRDKIILYYYNKDGRLIPIKVVLASDKSYVWDTSSLSKNSYVLRIADWTTDLIFQEIQINVGETSLPPPIIPPKTQPIIFIIVGIVIAALLFIFRKRLLKMI